MVHDKHNTPAISRSVCIDSDIGQVLEDLKQEN